MSRTALVDVTCDGGRTIRFRSPIPPPCGCGDDFAPFEYVAEAPRGTVRCVAAGCPGTTTLCDLHPVLLDELMRFVTIRAAVLSLVWLPGGSLQAADDAEKCSTFAWPLPDPDYSVRGLEYIRVHPSLRFLHALGVHAVDGRLPVRAALNSSSHVVVHDEEGVQVCRIPVSPSGIVRSSLVEDGSYWCLSGRMRCDSLCSAIRKKKRCGAKKAMVYFDALRLQIMASRWDPEVLCRNAELLALVKRMHAVQWAERVWA